MDKKGTKTMLMSVVMSAPGPLILGIGLLMGQSTTQIADFVRRSIELLAIIASFTAYRVTVKRGLDELKKERLENLTNIFVGAAMSIAGLIMLCVTLFLETEDKGNVIFGLIIAILGVIANSIFWIRYSKLSKSENSEILAVQSKLYRAKTLVDLCVTFALLSVLIAPGTAISDYFDSIGSVIVSAYLSYSGMKIMKDIVAKLQKEVND